MVSTQLCGYCGDADIIVRDEQRNIKSPGVGEKRPFCSSRFKVGSFE